MVDGYDVLLMHEDNLAVFLVPKFVSVCMYVRMYVCVPHKCLCQKRVSDHLELEVWLCHHEDAGN